MNSNSLSNDRVGYLKGGQYGGGLLVGGVVERYGRNGYIKRYQNGTPKFEEGSSSKLYFTNSQYVEYAYKLAQKIRANGVPKAIVAPLRGGWIGHIVAQELGIPFYPMYSSTRNDDKTVKPKKEQYFGYPSIPPEIDDIIMVDDMVDEGVTGKEIAEYFRTQPQIKKFRSAVLFQKQRERSYTADIVLHEIDDVWVCQPFETQYEDPEENQKVITACEEILRDLHRDTAEKLRAQELIDMFRMDNLTDTVSKRTKGRVQDVIGQERLAKHVSKIVIGKFDYLISSAGQSSKMYQEMLKDAMGYAELFSQSFASEIQASGGIIYKNSDFQGMMVAIALSRRYSIPIGTLLPDGRVICSTVMPIGFEKSLLVTPGETYTLTHIEDNLSPFVKGALDVLMYLLREEECIRKIELYPRNGLERRVSVALMKIIQDNPQFSPLQMNIVTQSTHPRNGTHNDQKPHHLSGMMINIGCVEARIGN